VYGYTYSRLTGPSEHDCIVVLGSGLIGGPPGAAPARRQTWINLTIRLAVAYWLVLL
jgi:hypothetical protein